jgi:hypothetical protein
MLRANLLASWGDVCVGTYWIAEEGMTDEAHRESVVGLEAAKHRAERRARDSSRAILVVESSSGDEVARFAPIRSSSLPPHEENRKSKTSDALLRLKEANQRLQKVVAPLPKRSDKRKP